jgi:hypothetical protein
MGLAPATSCHPIYQRVQQPKHQQPNINVLDTAQTAKITTQTSLKNNKTTLFCLVASNDSLHPDNYS